MLYRKDKEKTLAEQFKKPAPCFRAAPFWAWNGALDERVLRRQTQAFYEMGLGGWFMHVRYGLDDRYLGYKFMNMVDVCRKEAEKTGMLAWLYDEDKWPSGAAGGLGAAVLALGGTLVSGIDAVLDLAGFDEEARAADLIITGEGALDEQTAAGKVPVGVARRAKRVNPHARVVAVAGARADNLAAVYDAGIDLVLPILRRPMALSEALEPAEARANLVAAGEEAMRAYLLGR